MINSLVAFEYFVKCLLDAVRLTQNQATRF